MRNLRIPTSKTSKPQCAVTRTRATSAFTSTLLSSILAIGLLTNTLGCQSTGSLDIVESGFVPAGAVRPEDLLVVDCLLPGQVRKLGRSQVYMTPRRPTKTSGSECEIRGGEYTAYDRADYQTALRVWSEQARQGDAKAQTHVGEIHEKGLGIAPDYKVAAEWYRKAADQGFERAMLNLGGLYEQGLGVPKSTKQALAWYSKASGLEGAGLAYQTAQTAKSASPNKKVVIASAAPPTIQLIQPSIPQTRAIQVVYNPPRGVSRSTSKTHTLVGRVVAPAGLVGLFIDEVAHPVDSKGIFRAEISMMDSPRDVMLAAVDRLGRRGERTLRIGVDRAKQDRIESRARVGIPSRSRASRFGTYHALVIGNGAYRHLPKLGTAVADANAVAEVLRDQYHFNVTLVRDATRYDILSALNRLRAELTDDDNLLIYYAGHGELDKVNMRGQWLPVDAERESSANWISNVAITDILNAMNARHVLVVSDSCYSGALTRSTLASLDAALSDEKRQAWLETLASKRSRTALTSGGLAPVLDAGGGGHSVFANAFLDILAQNDNILEGQRLYQELSARVTYAARNYRFEQLPQYAPIKFAGHEAGDFFLVPSK